MTRLEKKQELFLKLLETRGVEKYKTLKLARENWDYFSKLDVIYCSINLLNYLLNIDNFDDTQIIKVRDKYYYWMSNVAESDYWNLSIKGD